MTEEDLETNSQSNINSKKRKNSALAEILESIFSIYNVLDKDKYKILIITLVFAVMSVIYALGVPNIYRSEALLLSNSSSSESDQVSALASIAGLQSGNNSLDDATLALAIIDSRDFVKSVLAKNDLLVKVMTLEGWDSQNNKDIYSSSYDIEKKAWIGKAPTDGEVYNKFVSLVDLSKNFRQGIYTISVETLSPEFSKILASTVIEEINDSVRVLRQREASENIAYLENQLSKNSVKDMKDIINQLIFEKAKNLMMAEVGKEFVFRVIDAPIIPEQKIYPVRSVICIVITLLGFFVAMSLSLMKHFYLVALNQVKKI